MSGCRGRVESELTDWIGHAVEADVAHLGLLRCMYLCHLGCVFLVCNCILCPHNITGVKENECFALSEM